MRSEAISAPGAPKAVGPYSHAVRVGDLLFCSGQIPLDPVTGQIVPGTIRQQTEQVIANIVSVLACQNLSLSHVVKSTVFMTNLGEFAEMNEAYGRHFQAPFPARSTVQVAALPRGANVEIEVIARYGTPCVV